MAGVGSGHVPTELPSYQEKHVRVYKLGTEVADVIRSAVEPGPEGDAKLKENAQDLTVLIDHREDPRTCH